MTALTIVGYNPRWPEVFTQEKQILAAALTPHIQTIAHIGSTAVPQLAAKPVIDMAITVQDIILIGYCIDTLLSLGYGYQGEQGIAGRHFFRKPPNGFERDFHLHMMEHTHPEFASMLLFRNYLRTHGDVAQEYAQLKQELAPRYPSDRASYTKAKTSFILSILTRARLENFSS